MNIRLAKVSAVANGFQPVFHLNEQVAAYLGLPD